jgi:hypothetical protein
MSSKNKVNLSSQTPTIRVLLHDAIEFIRVSLLFDDAFPNPKGALEVVQNSLISAAEKYLPGTLAIRDRLKCDNEYLSKMSLVVRVIFPNKYLTEIICRYAFAFH